MPRAAPCRPMPPHAASCPHLRRLRAAQVQENTATKYIPGILASACEFGESIPCKNNQADDLGRLHRRVAESFVKNQGDVNNDIMKVKTLMYAHLLREKVREAYRYIHYMRYRRYGRYIRHTSICCAKRGSPTPAPLDERMMGGKETDVTDVRV